MPAAGNNNPLHPSIPLNPSITIPINNTDAQTLVTAGSNGLVIEDIIIVNDDTSNSRVIELLIGDGTTDRPIGSATIPANAGKNGNQSAFLLSLLFLKPFTLQATYTLKIKAPVALTSTVHCTVLRGGDYAAIS